MVKMLDKISGVAPVGVFVKVEGRFSGYQSKSEIKIGITDTIKR